MFWKDKGIGLKIGVEWCVFIFGVDFFFLSGWFDHGAAKGLV